MGPVHTRKKKKDKKSVSAKMKQEWESVYPREKKEKRKQKEEGKKEKKKQKEEGTKEETEEGRSRRKKNDQDLQIRLRHLFSRSLVSLQGRGIQSERLRETKAEKARRPGESEREEPRFGRKRLVAWTNYFILYFSVFSFPKCCERRVPAQVVISQA